MNSWRRWLAGETFSDMITILVNKSFECYHKCFLPAVQGGSGGEESMKAGA
jgi:hypothetical protein